MEINKAETEAIRLKNKITDMKNGLSPMLKGFHICSVAQFRPDYLEKWLRRLADFGYNTVVWELENSIKWENCPECAAPDALSKNEFRKILALCRSLGLEPIPLFQTLGHCEYVLKTPEYSRFAEKPGCIDQYCPSNPEVLDFLGRWIEEYLELFGDVRYFHLGMDEARHIGECASCADFSAANSKSALYIRHVNTMSDKLIERNVRPIIWADMVLSHPEALADLSRKVILFDWMYDIRRNDAKVWVWNKGKFDKNSLPPDDRKLFDHVLFPLGDELGREPETFYTADFLAGQGFDVVTSPASSSYGDNVFSPRHFHHLSNVFDSFAKGAEKSMRGSVLTSWTVHLFPWELQLACLEVPKYIDQVRAPSIDDFQKWLPKELFDIDSTDFWKAAGLLSKSCLFSFTSSLGFNQSWLPVPEDFFSRSLNTLVDNGTLEQEYKNCNLRLAEYEAAARLFEIINVKALKGHEFIVFWRLAARNLVNRAKVSICLLENRLGVSPRTQMPAEVLDELYSIRVETAQVYHKIICQFRCEEIMSLMYDGLAAEIAKLIQTDTPR